MKSVASALVLSLAASLLSAASYPEEPAPPAPSPSPVPGKIRVEVISQLEKPIPSARVVLYRWPDPREREDDPCGSWAEIAPETVAPGVFEREVPAGNYRVEATGEEWLGAAEERVEVEAGGTRELRFSLEPGSVISGTVSDEEGNPLSGVEASYYLSGARTSVWLRSRDRRAVTDSAGRFAFRDLAEGVYNLKFTRPGYVEAEADDTATGTLDLAVKMRRGFTIRGRLEGDLEGLEPPVRLELEGATERHRRSFSRKVEPGPGSTFEIGDLERGTYSVRVQSGDRVSAWAREVAALPPEEAAPVTLTVSRGASLSGRVTAAGSGSPLPGVMLQLYPAGRRTGEFKGSDDRGEYSFPGLEGGEYTLKARLWQDGHSETRLEKKVVIEPGREMTGFDLELEAGRQVTFSGTVLDGKGSPVGEADLRVSFRPAGGKGYRRNFTDRAASGGSGDFALAVFLESGGEAVITAEKGGYAPAEKRIELSPEQCSVSGLVLVLDYGAALEVEVGSGEGGTDPVLSAIVKLSTEWSSDRQPRNYVNLKRLTDGRGRCRFENLSPGAYQVEVAKSGYCPAEEKVKLDGSEPVETVSLVLEPGRTLTVRVEDENGDAVEGAEIDAREKAGEMGFVPDLPSEGNLTDGAGICRLRDLPAGPLQLSVKAEGYVNVRRQAVGEGEYEVRVVMNSAGSVRGRFLDTSDRPLDGVNIFARKQGAGPLDFDSAFFHTRGLGDGVFRISRLPAGIYDLTVRSEDRAGKKIEGVEVAAGRETDLGEVVLGPGSTVSGRVRDGDGGAPLKGAWVRVEAAGAGMESIFASSDRTDAEGAFAVRGLVPGTVTVAVSAKDFRGERISGVALGSGEEKALPDIYLYRMTEAEREERARRRNVVPSLGVRIAEMEEKTAGRPPPSLRIEEVLPGSAAEKGGLAAGDEIVKVNGKSIAEDPMVFIQGLMSPPGKEIKVTVRRAGSGREEEVDLTVDQWSLDDLIRQAAE